MGFEQMVFFLSKTSKKYLSKLEKDIQLKIVSAIEGLPDQGDIQKMRGQYHPNTFRLRIGRFRVLYMRDEDTIKILDIDTRGDIYK